MFLDHHILKNICKFKKIYEIIFVFCLINFVFNKYLFALITACSEYSQFKKFSTIA